MSSRTVELQKMTAVEPQQNGHFERRSWLSDRRAECKHHEPLKCESYAHGVRLEWDIGETVIYLTLTEHAKFHKEREKMFGLRADRDAYNSIVQRMSWRQKNELLAIDRNETTTMKVRQEIIVRRKQLKGEC